MFQITEQTENDAGKFLTLTPEKGSAVQFQLDAHGQVWVAVLNASARLHRYTPGRPFDSFAAAAAGYKSTKVKAAIAAAETLLTT